MEWVVNLIGCNGPGGGCCVAFGCKVTAEPEEIRDKLRDFARQQFEKWGRAYDVEAFARTPDGKYSTVVVQKDPS